MTDSSSSSKSPRRPTYLAQPYEDAVEADKNFADNLRTLREEKGVSQAALAARMLELGFKFHQTTINKIENLERKVSVSEAGTLAILLGVNLEMLVASDRESPRWKAQAFRRSLEAFVRNFRHAENMAKIFKDRQEHLGQALDAWISAVRSSSFSEDEDFEDGVAELESRYRAWVEWSVPDEMLKGVYEMMMSAQALSANASADDGLEANLLAAMTPINETIASTKAKVEALEKQRRQQADSGDRSLG